MSDDDDDFDAEDDDADDDILFLLLMASILPAQGVTPSFLRSLTVDGRRRRSGKIRRGALQNSDESAFWTLFHSGHDDALITLCGFRRRMGVATGHHRCCGCKMKAPKILVTQQTMLY